MKYFAIEYPTPKKQGIPHVSDTPYQDIQDTLRDAKCDASVYRIVYKNKGYIIVLGRYIDESVSRKLTEYSKHATIATLPDVLLSQLLERRQQGTPLAQLTINKGFKFFERHETTVIPHENIKTTGNVLTTFDTEIAKSNVPGLATGSKVTMQVLPFIYVYEQLSEQETFDTLKRNIQESGMSHLLHDANSMQPAKEINEVNKLILRYARKYRFTTSAMKMYGDVKEHNKSTVIDARLSHWLELEKPIDTPFNKEIRALYLVNSYPMKEVQQASRDNKDMLSRMTKIYAPYKNILSLVIIDARCKPHFDFSYDTSTNTWVYLASHMCQWNTCQYPRKASFEDGYDVGLCIPCDMCVAACNYYATMLHTLLCMIQGDYSVTPDVPVFPTTEDTYMEKVKVTVGKGKNKHSISEEKKRTIPFTLITFDVSVKKPHDLPEDETSQDHIQKRDNWLRLANSDDIIYERKFIKEYARRYPLRRNGTRQEGNVSVKGEKNGYYKYVPMLRKERTKVMKVVASRYAEKTEHWRGQ